MHMHFLRCTAALCQISIKLPLWKVLNLTHSKPSFFSAFRLKNRPDLIPQMPLEMGSNQNCYSGRTCLLSSWTWHFHLCSLKKINIYIYIKIQPQSFPSSAIQKTISGPRVTYLATPAWLFSADISEAMRDLRLGRLGTQRMALTLTGWPDRWCGERRPDSLLSRRK